MPDKRKVFISYRHNAHKQYKDELIRLNNKYDLFIDMSVDSGEISDNLSDETIRQKIRDEKLKDSTVTILLYGRDINKRKFIDWEIAGSMIDYTNSANNQNSYRNAIIILDLEDSNAYSAHNTNYNDISDSINWVTCTSEQIASRDFWKSKWPYLPERIIDNMIEKQVCINIMPWNAFIKNPMKLKKLINIVAEDRKNNKYNTSRPLMRRNAY